MPCTTSSSSFSHRNSCAICSSVSSAIGDSRKSTKEAPIVVVADAVVPVVVLLVVVVVVVVVGVLVVGVLVEAMIPTKISKNSLLAI